MLSRTNPAIGGSPSFLGPTPAKNTVAVRTKAASLPLLVTGNTHCVTVYLISFHADLHLVNPLELAVSLGLDVGSRSRLTATALTI